MAGMAAPNGASGTALCHHPGMRVPIRWVLVRNPSGERELQAFLYTDLAGCSERGAAAAYDRTGEPSLGKSEGLEPPRSKPDKPSKRRR